MMRRGLALAAFTVLAGVWPVAAQQVFHAGTDTVLLSVTAVDGHNRAVSGLQASDFQIFEDGLAQDVSLFASDPQPIALSLLIDSSSSMETKLPVAQLAASEFCRRLKPNDVAQVIDFNSETTIRQPFTHDDAALDRAIHAIHAGGSTSLYTAIYIAIQELTRVVGASPDAIRRQAIILLSDGEDTTSLLPYDDILDAAKRSNVVVYAVGLRERSVFSHNAGSYDEGDYALRSLSQTTGGRAFFVDDVAQLTDVYGQIADELGNQYLMGYVSKNGKHDGGWRRISVRVTRPETIVRTKSGYFAAKDR